ncbi:hypothetical protein CANCADRAFT_87363 [Tortispora caseinolytica NRRL Y-17796]|uniref:Indoleamine 2,3-dioxygenase n=1 Tax=Tortispora caseinolytica NRRL Y-17796 TaxID=767744 RepID=A0A1E4TL86_9ASCO|nr:hypothetical protein CANCADRAFT_87363 [Tortispora caseinolytica NRRL Y-17796]
MRPQLLKLEDFDISPHTGFLPEQLPISHLDDRFAEWEHIAEDLPSLLMSRTLRHAVDSMPLLDPADLPDIRHYRRAYSILGFLVHAYIWESQPPKDHIPECLAKPILFLAETLELPPTATYSGLCLWNHRLTHAAETLAGSSYDNWNLSTLATITTFTGGFDESWFYLVSTVLEKEGASCLVHGLRAHEAIIRNDPQTLIEALQALAETIDYLIPILGRMYEQCDPHIFYYRLRPFLAGSKNMAPAGLPHGVKYGSEDFYRAYSGGSNAQSSLIQALDIFLGIRHLETTPNREPAVTDKDNKPGYSAPEKENSFIVDMRSYMPGPHRRFLESLSAGISIRDYVVDNSEDVPGLSLAYDACLAVLRAFRDKHVQIVSRYIIAQASNNRAGASDRTASPRRTGLASTDSKTGAALGTGGTALMAFLKQARDETSDPAAGSWGRRLLRTGPSLVYRQPERSNSKLRGLAENWVNDGDDKHVADA